MNAHPSGFTRSVLKVLFGVSLALALLIGRIACTSAPPRQEPAFGVAERGGAEPAGAEGDGAEPPAQERSESPPDAGARSQAAPTPPVERDPQGGTQGSAGSAPARGSSVAELLSRSDPRALALLSSVERELHRDPPAEVHELIARYRGGDGRDRLRSFVQQDFPQDLPLRVLALRWIDDVFPDPARAPSAPKPPSTGAAPRWIEPIEKR